MAMDMKIAENSGLKVAYKDLLNSPQLKAIVERQGKSPEAFLLSMMTVFKHNAMLAKAEPNSIKAAVFTAASINLPISDQLGYAYVVPFKDKTDGLIKAQFQIGYRGLVQLALRSGQFLKITVRKVYDGQLTGYDNETGEAQFDFNRQESDKVIGYRAYFKLVNGFTAQLYMTIDELREHASKYSQSFKKGYGLWKDDFDAMAKKTVLKLLLARYAPMTVEMQKAIEADQSTGNDEYPDNPKNMSPEAVAREKELARLYEWIDKAKTVKELQEASQFVVDAEDDALMKAYTDKMIKLQNEKENKK